LGTPDHFLDPWAITGRFRLEVLIGLVRVPLLEDLIIGVVIAENGVHGWERWCWAWDLGRESRDGSGMKWMDKCS